MIDPALAPEEYGDLTTTGRTSGLPREIEIWFALEASTIYMAAGERERSHWVRNLMAEPRVTMRITGETVEGTARVLEARTAQDALARRLLVEKYGPGYAGGLSSWGRTALPVAIEPVAAKP